MKEIRRDDAQFPENPSPRPTDAPLARPPRRRLNLARAGVALAGIALLGLGGFALSAYQAWAKPMPLKHRVVTTVSALPALASVPADVMDSAGEGVHVTSTTTYVGVPIVVSTTTSTAVHVALPASVKVAPAGQVVEIGPATDGLGWRSLPGTSSTTLAPATGWDGYASWFATFPSPGTYSIPVTLGTMAKTVTVHVLPLPKGAHLSVKTTPADHPSLVVTNPGNVPIHVSGAGLPSTLTPGQSVTVYPGAIYDVAQPQTAYSNQLGFSITQTFGNVSYSGTLTTHRRVSFRPPHPAFTLPPWLLLAVALAALLLASSLVASARGGRGVRGRADKGPGTAGK